MSPHYKRRKGEAAKIFYRRIITLEKRDLDAIWELANELGLGRHGFSAALRRIIREWQAGREGGGVTGPR